MFLLFVNRDGTVESTIDIPSAKETLYFGQIDGANSCYDAKRKRKNLNQPNKEYMPGTVNRKGAWKSRALLESLCQNSKAYRMEASAKLTVLLKAWVEAVCMDTQAQDGAEDMHSGIRRRSI